MKTILYLSPICLLLSSGTRAFPSHSSAEQTLSKYCEPLVAGSSAAQVLNAAKADGFQDYPVGGFRAVRIGELILGVSDAPRVCLVQAPTNMTLAQGIELVDAWAARHPGALEAAATRGPDGAPVKMWIAPKDRKSLLVNQQTNGRGQKVLNFVLSNLVVACLPAK